MNFIYYFKKAQIVLLCSLVFLSCKKNELRLTQYDLPENKAYVRLGLFSPGTSSTMIKVNDIKLNGSATSGSSGFFPAIVNSPDYAAISPSANFKLSLPNTATGNDSIVLFTGNIALVAQKFYSVCLADTGIDRTLFSIEDKFSSLPDSGFVKIRLINAMAKSEPLHFIRVDSTSASLVSRDTIARDITFKTTSDYIKTPISPKPLPSPQTGNYSFLRFRIVLANTGKPVGSASLPTTPTPNLRSMTTYAYGFGEGTGIFAPGLTSFVYNQ